MFVSESMGLNPIESLMHKYIDYNIAPLSSYDALKHYFTSLKTDLILLQPRVLERKFP